MSERKKAPIFDQDPSQLIAPREFPISRYQLPDARRNIFAKETHETLIVHADLPITELLDRADTKNEGKFARDGAFVVETVPQGRTPDAKYIVPSERMNIWHDGPVNKNLSAENFGKLHKDVTDYLSQQEELYEKNLFLAQGEERRHVRFLTPKAWNAAFVDRMYVVPTDEELEELQNKEPDLTILHAPDFKADPQKHGTYGKQPDAAIALDFDRKMAVVAGSQYGGETKKLGLTYMMGEMARVGNFPIHASAVITENGDTAIFTGLSGTGKTTLSSGEGMILIGDDEHIWHDGGTTNIEGGCYPKTIDLEETKEPEIFRNSQKPGSIMENVTLKPDGTPDFFDVSLTENGRAAFTLQEEGSDWEGKGEHPKNILFLTADASGVLPPISKLSKAQAQYYFISGYTSKVAGTEQGVTEPQPTFSACFAQPFLPLHPTEYAKLFQEKIQQQEAKGEKVNVWMINTGWNGNAYNENSEFDKKNRMSLELSRALVKAAISGELDDVETTTLPGFRLEIPTECPGVDARDLNPENSWTGKEELYKQKRAALAGKFNENFQKQKYDQYAAEAVKQAAPRI